MVKLEGSEDEICSQAKVTAYVFLRLKDFSKYKIWKNIEHKDCDKLDIK